MKASCIGRHRSVGSNNLLDGFIVFVITITSEDIFNTNAFNRVILHLIPACLWAGIFFDLLPISPLSRSRQYPFCIHAQYLLKPIKPVDSSSEKGINQIRIGDLSTVSVDNYFEDQNEKKNSGATKD
jgi:hypothetical protein